MDKQRLVKLLEVQKADKRLFKLCFYNTLSIANNLNKIITIKLIC
jgi:hypothetical protein